MTDDNAVVGLFRRDAPLVSYVSYEYIRGPSECIILRASRGYTNKYFLTDLTMASRVPFRVVN
jgi:hypothetical protein